MIIKSPAAGRESHDPGPQGIDARLGPGRLALVPVTASASAVDPAAFHLAASTMTVAQTVSNAMVTIERSNTSREAQIRYTTLPGSAIRGDDYTR